MKNLRLIQLFLLCLFISIDSFCQTNDAIVTSVPKTRVFYVGLDNELIVSPVNAIVNLSSPGGSITKIGNGKYLLTFLSTGTANIEFVTKKQTQRINIPIKKMPDPKIVFCGQSGGNITEDNLIECSQLDVDMCDFVYDGIVMDIIKFNAIIKKSNKINIQSAEQLVFQNDGKIFSDKLKAELKKLINGDIIIFEDIILKTKQDLVRKYTGNLTFVIEKK